MRQRHHMGLPSRQPKFNALGLDLDLDLDLDLEVAL